MIARWMTQAFDFILVLLCFVYAAAVTRALDRGRDHHRFQVYWPGLEVK